MITVISLYHHIPFCRTRCAYCAFNTYIGQAALIPAYIGALQQELRLVAAMTPANHVVNTIYFGGGTPSLLSPAAIDALLTRCAERFTLLPGAEITLEANPGSVSADELAGMRSAGVNRLSIGMQSAHDSELALIARGHTIADVQQTVRLARAAGFENLNLDLIYGIPHQTRAMWHHSLDVAIHLNPEHLSLYSLSVENATPMQRQIARGDLPAPDPDRAAELYEWASERLENAGFEQYEISNWAKPGFACQHNMHVWHNRPYLGIGAGAHGCAGGVRYANTRHPAEYIARIRAQSEQGASRPFPLTAAAAEIDHLAEADTMVDTMILGLRLTREGIIPAEFRARFGRDLWAVYGAELDRLIGYGLLERTQQAQGPTGVRLTPRGRLLGDHVFAAFV
jgi:oxygen-independent coproporphyrinogen-3 oxidase